MALKTDELPVRDLEASKEFFARLGVGFEDLCGGSLQDLDGHVWEVLYMEQQ